MLCSGQIYKLQPFMKNIIVHKHQNTGTHWNIVPPVGALFLGATKRGEPRQGGKNVVNGQCGDSFLREMNREVAARMSGSHGMNPIN